ncbi:transcriptional regulator [Aureimonas endophytica]|uniref:Transcriptional regulator n=1 Tax=Aureimonas endophytica TaxID=2027858 RepID=A0A917E3N3_9HYPH|nr:ROK family transcriptional regulator [Aureimonas endophytica]GGD98402.1 transcriptional regulator [Aureimonas endophytica]
MSMPRAVRHINEQRALAALFRRGPMSRAALARELGLTRSTAGSIVAGLVAEGLALEGETVDRAGAGAATGRLGTLVRLNAGHAAFVGADMGVGRFQLVALDLEARVIARHAEAFDAAALGPDGAIARLVALVAAFRETLGPDRRLQGLCATVPGIVDGEGTVVRLPILGWSGLPLLSRLREAFPAIEALAVENDANAFAMAEHYRAGDGRAAEAVHVFMDAGIGGAIFSQDRLRRGAHGYAGELGHLPLGERGFVEPPVLPGSLESFVGREAVLARHRFHGGEGQGLADLLARIAAGEPAAGRTLADWCHHLGRALAMIAALSDPAEIVLGGPVAALFEPGEALVLAALRAHLMPGHPLPRLARSPLGPEGPALGAAALMHRQALAVDDDLVYRGGRTG